MKRKKLTIEKKTESYTHKKKKSEDIKNENKFQNQCELHNGKVLYCADLVRYIFTFLSFSFCLRNGKSICKIWNSFFSLEYFAKLYCFIKYDRGRPRRVTPRSYLRIHSINFIIETFDFSPTIHVFNYILQKSKSYNSKKVRVLDCDYSNTNRHILLLQDLKTHQIYKENFATNEKKTLMMTLPFFNKKWNIVTKSYAIHFNVKRLFIHHRINSCSFRIKPNIKPSKRWNFHYEMFYNRFKREIYIIKNNINSQPKFEIVGYSLTEKKEIYHIIWEDEDIELIHPKEIPIHYDCSTDLFYGLFVVNFGAHLKKVTIKFYEINFIRKRLELKYSWIVYPLPLPLHTLSFSGFIQDYKLVLVTLMDTYVYTYDFSKMKSFLTPHS